MVIISWLQLIIGQFSATKIQIIIKKESSALLLFTNNFLPTCNQQAFCRLRNPLTSQVVVLTSGLNSRIGIIFYSCGQYLDNNTFNRLKIQRTDITSSKEGGPFSPPLLKNVCEIKILCCCLCWVNYFQLQKYCIFAIKTSIFTRKCYQFSPFCYQKV